MHAYLNLLLLFLSFSLYLAKPFDSLLGSNDAAAVESNVREAYAQAPFEDLQTAGTGRKSHGSTGDREEDDRDYYATKSSKGNNGYENFDSYHKKGGDRYGYETRSSFGKSSAGNGKGNLRTKGNYREGAGEAEPEERYYGREEFANPGQGEKSRDHRGAATDGDFYYSNYESEGDADSEHFSGDGDHFEDEGGHYFEGYRDDDSGEGYYEGEGSSDAYHDGEGETRMKSVVHHGRPAGGATSYSVRHY